MRGCEGHLVDLAYLRRELVLVGWVGDNPHRCCRDCALVRSVGRSTLELVDLGVLDVYQVVLHQSGDLNVPGGLDTGWVPEAAHGDSQCLRSDQLLVGELNQVAQTDLALLVVVGTCVPDERGCTSSAHGRRCSTNPDCSTVLSLVGHRDRLGEEEVDACSDGSVLDDAGNLTAGLEIKAVRCLLLHHPVHGGHVDKSDLVQ